MPQTTADASPDTVAIITEICELIRTDPETRHTLTLLSRRAGLSPAHFQRVFKRVVGVSPRQFADACRLNRFKAGLRQGESVTTAMCAAGYGSSSRLYEKTDGQLGMTPGDYRAGGRTALIRYSTAECALGRILLAVTGIGVCAVSIADTDDALEAFLRSEFPAAELVRTDDELAVWLEELLKAAAGGPHRALPLDVQATAFQRRVWEELQRIPRGETRTYRELAAAIGEPTAARAVARACATNPTAVLVPCHRVIGTDGKLRGYRWGLERKQQLLEAEKK
ncbi:MAG: bifunctional transcriptional activator/DNA repair enzyme protein Ada [Planctomycetaceae bacterium]|nr:bifunctional transcriptional activator/DNA repair enzyme protein Ada [Planctomycetaceae bacterium]